MTGSARTVCWLHACFQVPSDWEIIAYSLEERSGRLEFGNRRGFQALFSWEPCKTKPDRAALLAAFPPELRDGGSFVTADSGIFLLGWGRPDQNCLAAGYLAESHKLIQWIFPPTGSAGAEALAKPILESVTANAGALRRTCAFGFDFSLSAEYRIELARVQPADVELVFESSRKARAFFHRWGLPDALLNGKSMGDFYSDFLRSRGAKVGDRRSISVAGMEAVELDYQQSGEHQMDRFMGRLWTGGQARIWHDQAAKRLMAFEQIAPRNVELPSFDSVFWGASR